MRRDKTFPSIEKTVLASLVLSSSLSIAASASAQVIQNLANFNGTNGEFPNGLTLGSNGLFYVTTFEGGTNNCLYGCGTIFAFNPATNTLTDLANFNPTNGYHPFGSLTLGSNGLLYGTATSGGTNGDGTIFVFNPATNTLTDLANFNDTNGAFPNGSLTLGSNGLFYGTTQQGGTNNDGTIFAFNPANNALTDLASFNGTNGAVPNGSLTLGSNGLFYGTTFEGGTSTNGDGTIFAFNPATNTLTDLASFNGTNGAVPNGSLTLGSNGLFYGTTQQGGTNNDGTIFAFNPATNTLTDLANFNGTNGAVPYGSLTLGSNGLFYGTTQFGGPNNDGTIFAFDPGISSTPVPEPDENLALGVTVLGAITFLKRQMKKALKADN